MDPIDNPVLQAIRERRSIRRFTEEPVTREEVLAILEAGRWAPSGLNNQPWRFLVVFAQDPRQESLAAFTKYSRIVRTAQALVAVFLDTEKVYHTLKDHQSAGACIQNMLLAAHSLGLGAVWLGEILNQADEVLDLLELNSEAYAFVGLVALGRPADASASGRMALNDFLLERI